MRILAAARLAAIAVLAVVLVPAPVGAQTPGCDIVGTEGPDLLVGTDADEVICGLGGDDRILGGGGDDRLLGGSGNDVLRGGPGNDLLLGGGGDDDLNGQLGRDRVNGQRGADRLEGGPGRDRLLGGPGTDDCSDRGGRTRSRSCEGGAHALELAQVRWERLGADEYVYALSETPFCPPDHACIAVLRGPSVVRVAGGTVTTDFETPVGRTAEQLFAEASAALSAGGRASFDRTGLPTLIDPSLDGGVLFVSDIQLRDGLRSELESARVRWAAAEPAAYAFTSRVSCFCPGIVDVRTVVRDGEVESTEIVDQPVGEPWVPEPLTIDEHFDRIAELLDGTNIDVAAAFDPVTGMPTGYGFDASRLIADEETNVSLSDFEVIDAG